MAKDTNFFVVWNPTHGVPKYRHERRGTAEIEARRLASEHPGEQFYIMVAVAVAQTADPVILTELDEIPF